MIPFLKTDTPGLSQLETFIEGRGFTLKPVYSLKEFIELVIKEKAAIAIVSLDHKHPKANIIGQLLERGHGTIVIGITEQAGHLGSQIIKSCGLKQTVPPPVSGVGLERVLKASNEIVQNPSLRAKHSRSLGRDLVSVTGRVDDDASKAREQLHHLVKTESLNVPGWIPVEKPKNTVTSKVVCMVVEAPQLHGYLVAAVGPNRPIDDNFAEQIRLRLVSFLRSTGDPGPSQEFFQMKINEVAFEPWALRQAEVLRKTVHGEDEVAVAFFPRPMEELSPDSDEEPMVRVAISEILPDEPMRFDVFLHLPANNRYILYVAEGKRMELAQKQRLITRGITHLHAKRDSAKALKRYRAERFIRQQIEQFEKLVRGATS